MEIPDETSMFCYYMSTILDKNSAFDEEKWEDFIRSWGTRPRPAYYAAYFALLNRYIHDNKEDFPGLYSKRSKVSFDKINELTKKSETNKSDAPLNKKNRWYEPFMEIFSAENFHPYVDRDLDCDSNTVSEMSGALINTLRSAKFGGLAFLNVWERGVTPLSVRREEAATKGITAEEINGHTSFNANWLGPWTTSVKAALARYNIMPANADTLEDNSVGTSGSSHSLARYLDDYLHCRAIIKLHNRLRSNPN